MSEHPRHWALSLATILAASAASALLMVLAQDPALRIAYELLPGEKSSDGPLLVLGAYVVCVPATASILLVFPLVYRRIVGHKPSTVLAFLLAVASGPLLMSAFAFLSAWMARLP